MFNDMFLMHTRVILYCEMVQLLVGKEKETVIVHKDLLALHSIYFTTLFREKGPDADKKIAVNVKSSLFAEFVSWIYTGEFLEVENNALASGAAVDDLWALGRDFKAPAFQNFCMDDCRKYCKALEMELMQPWPFIEGMGLMYSLTQPKSWLRKLAIHSVSYKNPLQENEEGSPVYEKWKSFLTGQIRNKKGEEIKEPWVKELPNDWAVEAGKKWDGIASVSNFYTPLPSHGKTPSDTNNT
jgi:hypothetical protein